MNFAEFNSLFQLSVVPLLFRNTYLLFNQFRICENIYKKCGHNNHEKKKKLPPQHNFDRVSPATESPVTVNHIQ